MKRKIEQVAVFGLVAVGLIAWLVVLYAMSSRLSLWCGTLPSASDQYLDGSGRMFQGISWHLGNATRTWGETCGLKLNRFYVSFSVSHINPLVSPKDAHEEE